MEIIDWVKKQTGKIADNVKDYRFYVKHEPAVIDSSTTLVLTTFTNRDEVATVPCIYKWSRVRNGLVSEVPQFKGNSFICQPSDVGSIIQAEVTSTDGQNGGTAILQYGPVKLDVLIKKQIEHALGTGSAVLNVDLVQKNQIKDCQIKVMEDNIRITHCNSQNQYTFDYTIGQPRIEAIMKQPTKATIIFSEKHEVEVSKFIKGMFGGEDMTSSQRQRNEHRLELKFSNRATRDNFLFILKAFNTKRALKNSVIMGKIEQINFNDTGSFNYIMEIDSLKMDLYKLNKLNEKYYADKRMYFEEARRYEKQIQQTIVTYTKIAQNKWKTTNELDQSVMELRQKKDQAMDRKVQNLLRQNDMLNEKIAFLSSQLNNFYPQNQNKFNEPKMMSPSDFPRGGFIKKKQVGNNFEDILSSLNESQVKESGPLQNKVQQLSEEKKFLAKKLNESVKKIASLESKVRKYEHNNSAINLNYGLNKSELSMDKGNVTSYNMGEKKASEEKELKITNSQMIEETNRFRSDIPMISSKTEKYKVQLLEKKSQTSKKGKQENPQELKSSRSKESQLNKIIEEIAEQNIKLKYEVQTLTAEKNTLIKEKAALETKYKRKVQELGQEVSMYRRNQDALNRSQHLSMQMDLYNEEQNNLLKEQNQLLVGENEKLSKLCEKYMKEAKEIPKLKEQIMGLKKSHERKKTELSYSKDDDELLLEWKQ